MYQDSSDIPFEAELVSFFLGEGDYWWSRKEEIDRAEVEAEKEENRRRKRRGSVREKRVEGGGIFQHVFDESI